MEIENGTYSITINRQPYEQRSFYIERALFLSELYNKLNDKFSYEELEQISYLWSNIKHRNCIYSSKIMNKIKAISDNL